MRGKTLPMLALVLAACAPQAVRVPDEDPPAPVETPVASAESQALADHYASVQQHLLDLGLLRTDGGGEDTPFTDTILARAFTSVAFQAEFADGDVTKGRQDVPLLRWGGPIRVSLEFGASVPPDRAATERALVASYLARLAGLTGLSITLDDRNANFFIHIADVDERAKLGPRLAAELPGLTETQTAETLRLDQGTFCQVLTQNDSRAPIIRRALAVIPSEHPALMWQMCLHEEVAQALGLPNDSNLARPSIFNDDQEFALLTRMDELMLKILYSPELRPGMTAAEARPIVETLATRLIDGQT